MHTLDRTSIIFGILIGIIIGALAVTIIAIIGVSDVMSHIQIQSFNTTVNIPLNESRLIEAINQTRQ